MAKILTHGASRVCLETDRRTLSSRFGRAERPRSLGACTHVHATKFPPGSPKQARDFFKQGSANSFVIVGYETMLRGAYHCDQHPRKTMLWFRSTLK